MESMRNQSWEDQALPAPMRALIILDMLFFILVIFGGGYAFDRRLALSQPATHTQALRSPVDPLGDQIGSMTTELRYMAAANPAYWPDANTAATKRGPSTNPVSNQSPSPFPHFTSTPSATPVTSPRRQQSPSD